MKNFKIVSLLLSIFLVLALTMGIVGCSTNETNNEQKNEPTLSAEELKAQEEEEKVENVINLIYQACGVFDSTYATKEKIETAENEYEKLEDHLKTRVTNYDKLATAWKHYNYYNTYDTAKSRAESVLRASLKNPASLQVHSATVLICYDSTLTKQLAVHVDIDYSAQNGFGGYNRNNKLYTVKISETGTLESKEIGRFDFYNIVDENNGKIIRSAFELK